jgi:hypothetical protein
MRISLITVRCEKTMEDKRTLLKELFPDLVEEIRDLLKAEDRTELISSLETARVVDKCRCKDDFCSSIYTAAKPTGSWGPDHETVPLEPKQGMINLDVVAGKIVYVEVIDRPDIHKLVNKRIR